SVVPPGEVYREPGNRFSKEFTAVSSTFLVLQNGRGNAIRDRTHFRAAFPLEEHNEHQSGEPPGNPRGAFSAAPFAPGGTEPPGRDGGDYPPYCECHHFPER